MALRVLAMYKAKSKNAQPIKKSEWLFFNNGP